MEIKPDILLRVRFFTTEEGGLKKSLLASHLNLPLILDIDKYNNKEFLNFNDCRIFLESGELILGLTYDVKVKFLDIENVKHLLYVGKKIYVWHIKVIAEGEIIKIF